MGTLAPVGGRDCGDCTVCCIVPAIDDPDIQKRSGTRCRHCRAADADTDHTAGCTAYSTRPGVCRTFYCAWRLLPEMGEHWRPDRARVYATLEDITQSDLDTTAITLMLTGDAASTVQAPWFLDFVHARALAGAPMFLAIPGPPGHKPVRVILPLPAMLSAARTGSARLQAVLAQAVAFLAANPMGEHILTHTGHDVSAHDLTHDAGP